MIKFAPSSYSSLPNELAVFKLAQETLSTVILRDGKDLDLSRLTFLAFNAQIVKPLAGPISTTGRLTHKKEVEAGTQHQVDIQLFNENIAQAAKANFSVLERKRGLRSSILRNLNAPNPLNITKEPSKTVFFRDILQKYLQLQNTTMASGIWSLGALFAAAMQEEVFTQNLEIEVNFEVFGNANSLKPCDLFLGNSINAHQKVVEIKQNGHTIAHLNANNVL